MAESTGEKSTVEESPVEESPVEKRTVEKINADITKLQTECENRLTVLNNELTEAQLGTGDDNGDGSEDEEESESAPDPDLGGGRRRSRRRGFKGSKKSKSRKGNKMLSSWVAFVKKVQKEEQISYSQAMKRASARKKEWKMGQMGGGSMSMSEDVEGEEGDNTIVPTAPRMGMSGGRRRSKRRGSKKRRGSRRR
jgi:hypothetical protein